MATKRVAVKRAGEKTITEMEINNTTTAEDVLRHVGWLPEDENMVSIGIGQPPFGSQERVFEGVRDGGRLYVSQRAQAS